MHINLRNIMVVAILAAATPSAYADVVTDWNVKAGDIVVAGKRRRGCPTEPWRRSKLPYMRP